MEKSTVIPEHHSLARTILIRDGLLILVSIGVAIALTQSGAAHALIELLGNQRWLATIVAGMFFTSLFTAAPAIAILGEVAPTMSLPLYLILGSIGAVIGDYIIFRFIKNTVAKDAAYLLQFKKDKLPAIFKTRLFRTSVSLFGALIIATPLPNELGLTLLGLSSLSNRMVLFVSFFLNGAGILAVGLAARALAGV